MENMEKVIDKKINKRKPFRKRYRIREFSPIWWAGHLLAGAAVIASFYMLYCMLWVVEQGMLAG